MLRNISEIEVEKFRNAVECAAVNVLREKTNTHNKSVRVIQFHASTDLTSQPSLRVCVLHSVNIYSSTSIR